jgi:uncharacterized protein
MNVMDAKTPSRVMGQYDKPMWDSIERRAMALQRCCDCGGWQYPPGPSCPHCLSDRLEWRPISGRGRVISWVAFHRQYLPAYPAPYNAIAGELEEGPIMISNLEGAMPGAEVMGTEVRLVYSTMPDGITLPRFARAT